VDPDGGQRPPPHGRSSRASPESSRGGTTRSRSSR
jgi:hypothetical protein